jgi:hypothetical protein
LMHTLHRSAAEIIRQRITQATREDVPQRWHMAIGESAPATRRPGWERSREGGS